jgi:phospholipid/cholesterol/gamma-HCH transport system ATP-binding protein
MAELATADTAEPTDAPLVSIRGLRFRRGEQLIFDDIDLDVPRGSVTAVMGPSGAGKTTLLKLIGGQLRPEAGQIRVDGEDIHRLGRRGLYALRRRMGMLFQSGALLGDMSVFDNVAFPLREHTRLPESLLRRLVLMKLEAVGLRGAAPLMPAQLSGGMARRVALARAVALDPMMVMYDEPFTGQDPISMGVLVQLVRNLNNAVGLSSIIVSHDVPETLSIADYLFMAGVRAAVQHRRAVAADHRWSRGCSSAWCWPCRATMCCRSSAPRRASASWSRRRWCGNSARWSPPCWWPVAPAPR